MREGVLQNALWLALGRGLQMVLSLLVGLLTARYLGPEGYGLLQYAAGYTGFFSAIAALGLDAVLVRELTEKPEREGAILGTALGLRGAAGMLSAFAILCLLAGNREDPAVLAVTGLSSLGMALGCVNVFHAKFQAALRSRVTAVVLLAAHGAGAAYKLVLLALGKGTVWFGAAGAVEQLCAGGLLLWQYGRQGGAPLGISREMAGGLLSKSGHFILPGLMVAVYGQTDRIMLGRMLGEAETGYYGAAVSICGSWCFLLTAFMDAMYPQIARAYGNRACFQRKNRQLYAGIAYLSAAVSGFFCLVAEPLVRGLYGAEFLPAARILRVLTWYTAFSYLGVARNAWVVCENRQKYLIWVYLAAAVGNVGLNLVLIPRWGSMGAALASLAAQVLSAVAAPLCIPGLRENGVLMLEAMALRGVFGKEDGNGMES